MIRFFKKHLAVKVFLIVTFGLILGYIISIFEAPKENKVISPKKPERVWQIKSVDTMKFSRDTSLEKLNDPSFDLTIDAQVKTIKKLNANYVAIATPYDKTFVPILERWVKVARKYNLHVWFRGNFSGWEGWFGVEKNPTRDHHLTALKDFISSNPNLFKDGDAFSPCPECENGGPGDPRTSGDVVGFRNFMIAEKMAADEEFKKINKKVITNLASMNFDVAKLVMDKKTAMAMGNVIAIDHYVKTPEQLSSDITYLHDQTGANIFLGEIGVPIPDINGALSEQEQSAWVDKGLSLISKKPYVIGLNYWVNLGGTTAIFSQDLSPKPAATTLKKYFSLTNLY